MSTVSKRAVCTMVHYARVRSSCSARADSPRGIIGGKIVDTNGVMDKLRRGRGSVDATYSKQDLVLGPPSRASMLTDCRAVPFGQNPDGADYLRAPARAARCDCLHCHCPRATVRYRTRCFCRAHPRDLKVAHF